MSLPTVFSHALTCLSLSFISDEKIVKCGVPLSLVGDGRGSFSVISQKAMLSCSATEVVGQNSFESLK